MSCFVTNRDVVVLIDYDSPVHGEMLFKRQPAVGTDRRNAFAMRIF